MRGRGEFRGGYAEGLLALFSGAIGLLAVGITSPAAVILGVSALRHLPRTDTWKRRGALTAPRKMLRWGAGASG